jgi:hypothetical protein
MDLPIGIGEIVGVVGAGVGLLVKAKANNLVSEVKQALAAAKATRRVYAEAMADGEMTPAEVERVGKALTTAIDEIDDVVAVGLKIWKGRKKAA